MADVDFVCNTHLVVKAAQEALRKAGEQIGGMLEGKAKLLAPKKIGTLQNSIAYKVDQEGDTTTVIVGSNVEYAPYVELGHSQEPGRYVPAIGKRLVADYVEPRPFLRPAFEGSTSEIEQIVKQCVKG